LTTREFTPLEERLIDALILSMPRSGHPRQFIWTTLREILGDDNEIRARIDQARRNMTKALQSLGGPDPDDAFDPQ